MNINTTDSFHTRHIGPQKNDLNEMLDIIGASSIEQLIDETIPKAIRSTKSLDLPEEQSEYQFLQTLRDIALQNKLFKSFIGLGYYGSIVPAVIIRNVLENPGWYTQYTPYQAEISQGRLEALLNFQTMISDLTKMDIANASLLDEGTAAAEAMTMLYNIKNKNEDNNLTNVFLVSENCYPQTIAVLKSRALPLGIKINVGNHKSFEFSENVFGVLIQNPASDGLLVDYKNTISKAHDNNAYAVYAADLLSLTLVTPPGEIDADVVIGSTQRFGLPVGYGGPHAAYFATKNEFKRLIPGRIIGVSVDNHNNTAFRMALQTREQHIRREKATSNICTAQALLAIMSGMYAVYHGPEGLKAIAKRIHIMAKILNQGLSDIGYTQKNDHFFDTLCIKADHPEIIREIAEKARINFRYIDHNYIGVSLDETTLPDDLQNILSIFSTAKGITNNVPDITQLVDVQNVDFPDSLSRKSDFLSHPVFNQYHSETKMLRYIKELEKKDLSLTTSMISLGSCTMKLNAVVEMLPVSWPEFSDIHPFVPIEQAKGYGKIINDLEKYLCEITGMDSCSLQPNSGAQGEFTGLTIIRAYHHNHGNSNRNIILIPSSAHGTNPASAIAAGMKLHIVGCDENGNIDIEDLKKKATENSENLAGLMVTYPSTHGVFEESIQEVCKTIHDNGGMVYMDGANMNAQVGLTSPAIIGVDVCHLNLHKTFAIPHGGGGPGLGPICVTKQLAPYLPGHPIIKTGGEKAVDAVASAPWSSANIMVISYAYIKLLGPYGCTEASKYAILNANYIKSRLEKYYPVLYQGKNGRVAHELILDCRPYKKSPGIDAEDIAKRLIDYNFHAPTVSFPVPGTLMVEPTESEPKDELDRFCDAMISIKHEIDEITDDNSKLDDNVLKNAPHTAEEVSSDNWVHSYSREKAAYPLPYLKVNKFWAPVGRVNNSYGDRNLMCVCPPTGSYVEIEETSGT